jgi:hypothetical protein
MVYHSIVSGHMDVNYQLTIAVSTIVSECLPRTVSDYEQTIINLLEPEQSSDIKNKHLFILKATGLGLTELTLRYMVYLATRDNALANSTMCIVTGPRIDLAENLIQRIKNLFRTHLGADATSALPETRSTIAQVNNVNIVAFPSHHLSSMRGLENVSFIFLDESAFFPPGQQQEAIDVSHRYIGKSDPYLVLVSTPNEPGDLMDRIKQEPENSCIYHRLYLDYTYGIGRIYSPDEIARAKASISFDREYDLKFTGGIGDVFHRLDIDAITSDHYEYKAINLSGPHYMGIDPGFGSSSTGIVITRYQNQKLEVVHAEEITKGIYEEIHKHILDLAKEYNIGKIFVDGSATALIRSLKVSLQEYTRYDILEKNNSKVLEQWIYSGMNEPTVVPVNFAKYHREMLQKLMLIVSKHTIRIDPSFNKLIIGLRSAQAKGDKYSLDKDKTVYDDLVDALRLSCMSMRFKGM